MAAEVSGQAGTRTRLLATALKLFTEHGVEGTSLQMIADALGVTKAAVYYHFKTKDEIAHAVAAPGLAELSAVVDEAARQRRRGAQIDYLLTGFIDIVVRHRALISLFTRDPMVARMLTGTWSGKENFRERMLTLLAPEGDTARLVVAEAAIAGIALAGGSADVADVDDETLRCYLLEVARKIFGRPRTTQACLEKLKRGDT